MSRRYSIGEAAKLLHVSRDTLRFYEKKKLTAPGKAENGYRCYTEEDIRMLLDLIYLRRLQCSIQDIQRLYGDGSLAYMEGFLDQRIQEEEKEIRFHQQMLHQLKVTRYTRRKIAEPFGQYSLRQIPRTYIFSEKLSDYDLVRDAWFRAIEKEERLENCYLHEQWGVGEDGQERQYYLVLEEPAVKELGLEEIAVTAPSFAFGRSVHCCVCLQEHVAHSRRYLGHGPLGQGAGHRPDRAGPRPLPVEPLSRREAGDFLYRDVYAGRRINAGA